MICENCSIVELAAARYRTQARRPAVTLAVELCPLHAAAPDLLTALEKLMPQFAVLRQTMAGAWLDELEKEARDAVAQAKGETDGCD